jgi:branched-chain amino acid transport system substrate-binding protein
VPWRGATPCGTGPTTISLAFASRYQKKFNRAPDYHSASNYAAGQVLEAVVKQVGSLDQDKLAAAIAKLKLDTVYGRFQVDDKSIQVGYTSALLQWQKGKQVLVWPEKLAEREPILPTPAWSSRQ